jgi:tetratricopeptide (TPR) repeat protein
MLVFALFKARKLPVISFGILFFLFLLAPTANLFFLSGSTVAERFLFFPSLGLILAVVFGLAMLLKVNIQTYAGPNVKKLNWILGIVIVLFMGLTMARSGDWRSNETIYEAGVQVSPGSSRTNGNLGNEYYKLGQMERNAQLRNSYFSDAVRYCQKALDIFPNNQAALHVISMAYAGLGDRGKAYASYHNTLKIFPNHRSTLNNMGAFFLEEKNYDSAFYYFKRCFDVQPRFAKSSQNLAMCYYYTGNYNKAIEFASNAIKLDKYQVVCYDIISKAYAALGNQTEALNYQRQYSIMQREFQQNNIGANLNNSE